LAGKGTNFHKTQAGSQPICEVSRRNPRPCARQTIPAS